MWLTEEPEYCTRHKIAMPSIDQFDIGISAHTNPINSAEIMHVNVYLEFTRELFMPCWVSECGKL